MKLIDMLNEPVIELRKQIFKLFGENFRIYGPGDRFMFICHKKGFKLKEDIRIYADEAMTQELMSIQARQVMDFSGAYDVIDSTTQMRVGVLKRKGWKSLAQDEWTVCDQNEVPIGTLVEDNIALAILRRFLSNLIPQNYDLLINGARVLDLRQNFNPFSYRLVIDFSLDTNRQLDRRLGLAAAVLLAAIEGRQN